MKNSPLTLFHDRELQVNLVDFQRGILMNFDQLVSTEPFLKHPDDF